MEQVLTNPGSQTELAVKMIDELGSDLAVKMIDKLDSELALKMKIRL